ncbi:hypothetical protein IEQ34_002102 [Dendrobium chrysotoxum]|uniref:Uncharacterized protein n=1 Tax=Dendrobium chrysotoxum TaxID=161865 RepID=A0AAV7H416_DENCH|nr:hypothetical protein IEQ34_002102 [Dendrobium chrysotoxum]
MRNKALDGGNASRRRERMVGDSDEGSGGNSGEGAVVEQVGGGLTGAGLAGTDGGAGEGELFVVVDDDGFDDGNAVARLVFEEVGAA